MSLAGNAVVILGASLAIALYWEKYLYRGNDDLKLNLENYNKLN